MEGSVIFRQLFEPTSCTYTYLLGDPESLSIRRALTSLYPLGKYSYSAYPFR